MADTITTRLQLTQQEVGGNSNTWGEILNTNFGNLETAIAAVTAIATTGGSTTLTDDEARGAVLSLTGTLTSNATLVVPSHSKLYVIRNDCTIGAYSVSIKTSAGSAITVPQGAYPVSFIYCDGTTCYLIGADETSIDGKIDTDVEAANRIYTATVAGTANAIELSAYPSGFSLAAGKAILLLPTSDNTGPTTINTDATGIKNLYKQTPTGSKACIGGELKASSPGLVIYDGTQYVLVNPMSERPLVALASATTTDLGTKSSQSVYITGTTTITSFGSSASTRGPLFFILFEDALTLTHNATSLKLPGGANITTAANDSAIAEYLGSGNWIVRHYQRASGLPVVSPASEIPSQTGNAGKPLTTDGSALEFAGWKIVAAGRVTNGTSGTPTINSNINAASISQSGGIYNITFTDDIGTSEFIVIATVTAQGVNPVDIVKTIYNMASTGFSLATGRGDTAGNQAVAGFNFVVVVVG